MGAIRAALALALDLDPEAALAFTIENCSITRIDRIHGMLVAPSSSYVTAPGAGARGREEGEAAFPFSTASWFFLDAVDVTAPAGTPVIVGFGDSITDGTASTMNGDDRWPDVLSRRLHAIYGNRVAVVNAGIGGNQIAGPKEYGPEKPFPGGPSAGQRLERDVLRLSGVTTVIWLEGINDFSKSGNAAVEDVVAGMREGVARMRAGIPGVRVIGGTVVSALGSRRRRAGSAVDLESGCPPGPY